VNAFAALLTALERARSTGRKLELLTAYFKVAPAGDAAWALHLLTGRRPQRIATGPELRRWLGEATGLSGTVLEATYAHVGDLAETLALVLPPPRAGTQAPETSLQALLENTLAPLRGASAEARKSTLLTLWQAYPQGPRLWLNKLITGGLRVGVGEGLTLRALGQAFGLDPAVLQHRWMTPQAPTAEAFNALVDPEQATLHWAAPYPFCLAQPLRDGALPPHPSTAVLAEWKWDGVRCQLVRREGKTALWSRGRDRLENRFPELTAAADDLPEGTVLDGELLAWAENGPGPFVELSRRLQRKRVTAALQRAVPVRFMAYDLLELHGEDLRPQPLEQRRQRLETLLSPAPAPALLLSPRLDNRSWESLAALRADARRQAAEGLMLKHEASAYESGRRHQSWWKWKLDPETVDAILLYAQPGHGRRANLYTDFTFAVWDQGALVPLAKAYSGLDEPTLERLDHWIRRNTKERFGPVRAVTPALVFELAFDSAHPAPRRKAGMALRFPRIHRWREDLAIEDADALETLRARLLPHG
jgi:DNA ligase-1